MRMLLIMLLISSPVRWTYGQTAFEAATGKAIVLSSQPLALTIDASQSALAIDLLHEIRASEDDLANHKFGSHWDISAHFGIAAEKGKRSIFSSEGFTPGYELLLAVALVDELESDCYESFPDGRCRKSRRGGYHGPFLTLAAENVQRKTALIPASGIINFDSEIETKLSLAMGYRYAPSERHTFGIGVEGQQNWSATKSLKTSRVCTTTGQAQDAKGNAVTISSCEDRYVNELPDLKGIKVRFDYHSVLSISADKPGLGLLASGVWDKLEDLDATMSLAVGPVLLKANEPRKALAGLLLTATEFKSVNGLFNDFDDFFGVQLYISIKLPPF